MKYYVKHIYEKDYGCEGRPEGEKPKVEVVLGADKSADAEGDIIIEAEDAWMYAHGIKEGDIWPSEYPTVLSVNYKAVRDEVDKAWSAELRCMILGSKGAMCRWCIFSSALADS